MAGVREGRRDLPPLARACVGEVVGTYLLVFVPLTQTGLNPVRDLGPRLFALLAGWGDMALPRPGDTWWAYVVGPLAGGPPDPSCASGSEDEQLAVYRRVRDGLHARILDEVLPAAAARAAP